ncbi:hypothetical protein RvY_11247 [Ramazzottius varieornatus]|uniref:Uncharacterized protein n=1 Tax=Ramazzottius varieornatus TaxID=947166 RepID=A0A1D1VJV4_RAMVA|nr:hypothetical protein RvY_11247 [Ramazzottius varieornatus]
MADPRHWPHALFVCTVFCLLTSVVCIPKPNATSSGLNLVLHPEKLIFGRFSGPTDNFVEKKSPPVSVDKQLHVRCFQELRSERNGTNVTDGFYVRTDDSLYGTWTIPTKLPSNTQAAMRIELRIQPVLALHESFVVRSAHTLDG